MPIVVNTNTTAVTASFNLSHANDALRKPRPALIGQADCPRTMRAEWPWRTS